MEGTATVSNEIRQYMAVGAGPLLRHIIGEQQFIKVFHISCPIKYVNYK